MPTLTLVAHDYLHRLAQGRRARLRPAAGLPGRRASSSAENLLIPLIDPAIIAASTAMAALNVIFSGTARKQAGQSDLAAAAARSPTSYDADFWVEGDVLYLLALHQGVHAAPDPHLGRVAARLLPADQHRRPGRRRLDEVHAARDPAHFLVTVVLGLRPRERSRSRWCPARRPRGASAVAGPSSRSSTGRSRSPADIANSALSHRTTSCASKLNSRLTGSGIGDRRPAHPRRRGDPPRGARPGLQRRLPRDAAPPTRSTAAATAPSFEVSKEIIP